MNAIAKLLALASATFFSFPAFAATVTFDELTTTNFFDGYQSVISGGYRFTNSANGSESFIVWGSNRQFNADQMGATLSNNYGGSTTTVSRTDGAVFVLYSIDLADLYNNGSSGKVLFNFFGSSGSSTQTISLDGLVGLQTVNFNLSGITSFNYTPLTTPGPWIQVDNLVSGAAGSVPEPATWAMMLFGFGIVGAGVRSRRNPTVQLTYA